MIRRPVAPTHHGALSPEEAFRALIDMPRKREKLFLARMWTRDEKPFCVCLRASGLSEASTKAHAMKAILDEDDEYLRSLISVVARVINEDDARRCFADIGMPIDFNTAFHTTDDVKVVPFTTQTGFTSRTIVEIGDTLPNDEFR